MHERATFTLWHLAYIFVQLKITEQGQSRILGAIVVKGPIVKRFGQPQHLNQWPSSHRHRAITCSVIHYTHHTAQRALWQQGLASAQFGVLFLGLQCCFSAVYYLFLSCLLAFHVCFCCSHYQSLVCYGFVVQLAGLFICEVIILVFLVQGVLTYIGSGCSVLSLWK